MALATDLRAAMDHLAAMDRASCSPGEHEAARWIAEALTERGAPAQVEVERVHGSYWWPLGLCAAAGLAATVAGRRRHRLLGAALGVAGAATVVDELAAGRRWLRRLLPKQRTANAVGRGGDPSADRTLVLAAHHDAAHTSVFFDPRLTALVSPRFDPAVDPPPRAMAMMAPIAAAPALAGLAAAAGARRLGLLAAVSCAGIIASFAEMAQRRTVPGANDDLTGVVTLLGVARALQERPVRGLRVLFVSTGSEESLMEGMRAFVARHDHDLDPARTTVLAVDTVGSPYLVLPDAEGMLLTHRYHPDVVELVARCAADAGIGLVRGMTVRLGTDALVALRRHIPAAMLMSVGDRGVSTNYHWPTDTPDRVDAARVADAITVCEAVVRRLAKRPSDRR